MVKTVKPKDGNAKKKKSKRKAPSAVAMAMKVKQAALPSKENPFEAIWSRRKFDILGKKRRDEERRIGQARSRAIDKRKNTLLKEYEKSRKSSVFVDKRIGESNDQLGEFDKAIMRSQRERQIRLGKMAKFNVPDGDDDDLGIPSLNHEMDGFEDEGQLTDDDTNVEENYTKQRVDSENYNTEEVEPSFDMENKHKTKKEVMSEIIMKSKFFKAQKAKEKDENEQLMEKLDKNFTSLLESQVLLSMPQTRNIATSNDSVRKGENPPMGLVHDLEQDKPDYYDKLVKEMSVDMRAKPSDRTKTPEEIAQEERERLEKLEDDRKKRMVAADDGSDEDNDDTEKYHRSVSGDDLGDSFSHAEEPVKKKGWVDEILERENSLDSGDESCSGSEASDGNEDDDDSDGYNIDNDDNNADVSLLKHSRKDWEQSDDDSGEYDCDEDKNERTLRGVVEENEANDCILNNKDVRSMKLVQSNEINQELSVGKKENVHGKRHASQLDIPFVIESPNSFEELRSLLENRSNADVIVIINRIRTCNAIRLAAENRKKMQVFYGILLQYFAVLTSTNPINVELINLLVNPLIELSMEIPYFSAICARHRISHIRSQFSEAIKNAEISWWPSFKTLCLFRLWFMIFPCSDFRHPVITPAVLLMCEYLMRCPISTPRDIAIGSFLCTMILSVSKQSKKFFPEAVVFLQNVLTAIKTGEKRYELQWCNWIDTDSLRTMLFIRTKVEVIKPLNLPMIMQMADDSPFFCSDDFRASLLYTIIGTFKGFVETWKELKSFPELFLPISAVLSDLSQQDNIPTSLRVIFAEACHFVREKSDEHHMLRRPLQMQKRKPVPIKTLVPKYEENFVKGRDYDPDRERVERKKLKKLLAREAKGAARELRKDNYFLLDVKEKERAVMEEERAERFGKTRAFLQDQEHAFKSGQLGKGRKRRR